MAMLAVLAPCVVLLSNPLAQLIAVSTLLLAAFTFPFSWLREAPPPGTAAALGGAVSGARRAPRRERVSVCTVGCVIEWAADGRVVLLPCGVRAIRALAVRADVYLVTEVPCDSDAEEAAVMSTLRMAGVFEPGGCDERKALFCSTADGRGSICRQLGASTHFEASAAIARYLAPHLPTVVLAAPRGLSMLEEIDGLNGAKIASSFSEYVLGIE